MIQSRGDDTVTIRLPTTIIEYTAAPAEKLAAVYAERWDTNSSSTKSKPTRCTHRKSSGPGHRNW
jgi:hypothetical protein